MDKKINSHRQRAKEEIGILIEDLKKRKIERLPNEGELIEKLNLSRHTLRETIEAYVTAGILEKIQGKGTFIVKNISRINFSGWIGTEPPGDKNITKMVSNFEKTHHNYKICYHPIPYYQSIARTISSALKGTVADVLQLTPHFSSILHDFDILVPLDQYLNQNNLKRRYPVDIESGRIGNSLFTVTWALSPFILYINTNVLKRAGIEEEIIPETLDQLLELCERVNRSGKPNTWGISIPLLSEDPVFLWLYPYFLSFNGGFSNSIGNIIIDSEENIKALNWLGELYKKGAVPGIKGVVEGRVLFASDQIAFWIDGPWARGIFRKISGFREEFDSHYSVAKIPVGQSGRSESILFNHQLGISRQCRDIKSAYKWIEYLTTDEEIGKYCFKESGSLTSMRDNLHKPFFTEDAFAAICLEQMETVSALPINHPFFTKSLSFISQIIAESITCNDNNGEWLKLSKKIIDMIGKNAFLGFYPH